VSYPEAKAEIARTSERLAAKLQASDKGFHYAIRKLSQSGEIVSYKAHIFSPEVFHWFKANLDAGRIRDIKIHNAAHRSLMGEAIVEMLSARKAGAESGHVIWHLRKNPEFAQIIDRHKSHAYNVLARLVRTGEIIRRGKRYYARPEDEAPPDSGSASASSGEGGSSPAESRLRG
jgi:hypothetical protein